MNKQEIIKKYDTKLKNLISYRKKLQNEYAKHTSQNIKEDYYNALGKINILIQVLEDLEKMEG